MAFEAGQHVEARFGGKSRYYGATVMKNNGDGSYELMYDDGDSEEMAASLGFEEGSSDASSETLKTAGIESAIVLTITRSECAALKTRSRRMARKRRSTRMIVGGKGKGDALATREVVMSRREMQTRKKSKLFHGSM